MGFIDVIKDVDADFVALFDIMRLNEKYCSCQDSGRE